MPWAWAAEPSVTRAGRRPLTLDRRLVANGAEAIDAALLMVSGRSQLRHGYTPTVRAELEMSEPLARTISNNNNPRGAKPGKIMPD